MQKLKEDEWNEVRRRFIAYLNSFEHDPELSLQDDYFYDHNVVADERWYGMYRFLLIECLTEDDGGPSMLYLHTSTDDIGQIEFAAHTFDSITSVWIGGEK